MPANVYECLFLLDANKVAGDLDGVVKHLHTMVEKHHGEILISRQWDDRRLAYAIHGQKKGIYYVLYFRSEGKNLVEIERDVAINEAVIRYLPIKLYHPRIVDGMLAAAREERNAYAMQTVTDPGPDDGLGDEPRERGGRRERYSRSD